MNGVIDRIGMLDAQLAQLKAERDILADAIKAKGPGTYLGGLFAAVVSEQERVTTDWKEVAKKAGASSQLIAWNSKVSKVAVLKLRGLAKEAA